MKNQAERLQKFLAQAGVASRRASEDLIIAGRVQVNGETVLQLGYKINPRSDVVTLDGRRIKANQKPNTYIILHKPCFVLSAASDGRGRKTVLDLVETEERLYPVGRLDYRSEGLVLLTNDGPLAQKLTHPANGHEREYIILVTGKPSLKTLERWRAGGFEVDGKAVGPMQVEAQSHLGPGWLKIILTEGRKRQIRTVAEMLDHPVKTLRRVRFGSLSLGNLRLGQWRHLTSREVQVLKRSVDAKKPVPQANRGKK